MLAGQGACLMPAQAAHLMRALMRPSVSILPIIMSPCATSQHRNFTVVSFRCSALRLCPGMPQTAWIALVRHSSDAASHCLYFGIYSATSCFAPRSYQGVAHLAADQIGPKLIRAHRHFHRLVVLRWHVDIAHENAVHVSRHAVSAQRSKLKALESASNNNEPQARHLHFTRLHTCGRAGSSGSRAL